MIRQHPSRLILLSCLLATQSAHASRDTDVHECTATAGALPGNAESRQPIRISGDIEEYLKDISYGEDDDGAWTQPSEETIESFQQALHALITGDMDQAMAQASAIDFQIIEYTDPARGTFLVLRDTPDRGNQSAGGTYVWNPRAAWPVVVEVPHPSHDSATDKQGIELFIDAQASVLLLSGTHRNSHHAASTCSSGSSDYRRSDAAHAVTHLFHAAHVQTEESLSEPVYLQLHGFGSKAYKRLKEQCDHDAPKPDAELLINLSEGVRGGGKLHGAVSEKGGSKDGSQGGSGDELVQVLADTVNQDGTIKACLYNDDTEIYGGTLNVQGRYTNGSPDPCRRPARQSSGRFIHVEQSYNTRHEERTLLNRLIAEALDSYFD